MAAITAEEVVVDLLARTDKLERALVQAGKSVDQRLNGMEARGAAFAGRFTGLLAGVSAGALVAELAKLADTSKQLDAQLRLATSGFGSYGKAQEDVRRIAEGTRSSLTATATLYGNFVRATEQLGGTQSQAARATETFAKALKIGGADANAAAAATLQFGQALASGALRGDEFNSIAEASPRIVRLIADAMGVTQGAVRALAAEGKLTGDVLIRALTHRKFTAGIDAEFKQLPTTFSDAMQAVENAAVVTFGAFDKGGQFSNAITNMLTEGTATFAGLEQAAEKFGVTNRAVIDGLVTTFQTLKGEAEATATATGDQFSALSSTLATVFDPLGTNATTVFGAVRKEADYTVGTIANLLSGIDQLRNFLPDLQRRAQKFDESTFGRRLGFTGDLGPRSELAGQFRQSVARSRIAAATARNERVTAGVAVRPARAAATPPAGSGKAKKSSGTKSKLDPEAFAREEQQLNDRLLRAKGDQAQSAESAAGVELARIDSAHKRFEGEVAADKRLTNPQRRRLLALDQLVAATERAVAIRERDVAVEARTAALIRRQYQSADAANRNEQDTLRSRLDLATTAKERREIELRLLALAQQQERADQEQLIADRQRIVGDPNASEDAKSAAGADITDARGRLSSLPEQQANERRSVEQRNGGPLDSYLRGVPKTAGEINEALQAVTVDGLQSLEDGLLGIVTGTESVGNAFKKMANSIIKDLLRIAIQQAIVSAIGGSAGGGAAGGASGGIGSAIGGLLSSLFGGGSKTKLPRLANGGSIAAGGTGGVDRNVLSVNGVPKAMISASERLSVINPNVTGAMANVRAQPIRNTTTVHQHFSLDLRGGMTTPQLLAGVQNYVDQQGRQVFKAATATARQEAPGAMARYQRLGTGR